MGGMRIPGLRKTIQNNDGGYMAVGSKRHTKPWTPKVHTSESEPEEVPRRFRGLRLRRRRSTEEPTPYYVWLPVFLVVVGFLFLLVYRMRFGGSVG